MKIRHFIALALLASVLVGCDVPGYLMVRNKTSNLVSLNIVQKGSPAVGDHVNFIKEGNIGMQVSGDNKAMVLFGYWVFWTKERCAEYAAKVDRIEISTVEGRSVLKGTDEIYEFLLKHRRGLMHQGVVIKLKDGESPFAGLNTAENDG